MPNTHRLSAPLLVTTLLAVLHGGALAAIERGDSLVIQGYVADASGRGLADVHVVFEAARAGFSLRELRMATGEVRRLETVTGKDGSYRFTWTFDPFFNHFEIRAILPPRREGGSTQVLARREVTDLVQLGGPVVANLSLDRANLLTQVREFEASVDSADERRIFGEQGRPDHVQTIRYANGEETSWWYFEDGEVHYFRSGALVETRSFPPPSAGGEAASGAGPR